MLYIYVYIYVCMYTVLCLVAQSCPTLCDPMNCSPPGSSVRGGSPGKNTGMGSHALLQGIFSIQGLNPGVPHCRWILYHLSYQGSSFSYPVYLFNSFVFLNFLSVCWHSLCHYTYSFGFGIWNFGWLISPSLLLYSWES